MAPTSGEQCAWRTHGTSAACFFLCLKYPAFLSNPICGALRWQYCGPGLLCRMWTKTVMEQSFLNYLCKSQANAGQHRETMALRTHAVLLKNAQRSHLDTDESKSCTRRSEKIPKALTASWYVVTYHEWSNLTSTLLAQNVKHWQVITVEGRTEFADSP